MTSQRWRALLFAVMLAGLLFAIRPLNSRLDPETLFLHSDKISHVLFFGLLWLLSRRAGFAAGWPLALSLLGFGVGIEIAQQLSPTGRSASLTDVAADVVGIALGWWLTRRLNLSVGQPQEDRR
jgi:VanZ family protein